MHQTDRQTDSSQYSDCHLVDSDVIDYPPQHAHTHTHTHAHYGHLNTVVAVCKTAEGAIALLAKPVEH